MANKLLIHKQPWKTWETDEVNQLHLTPMFEFKAMKANEEDFYSFYVVCRIHLFQKTLSERTANGSCRTEIARPKGTVVSIFAKNTMSSSQLRRQQKPHRFAYLTMKNSIFARFARAFFIF